MFKFIDKVRKQFFQNSKVDKNNNKKILDAIQKNIYLSVLKKNNFKKFGRTFNRLGEDGLIEIINFQSGRFDKNTKIKKAVIPGFKNTYGYFTINLGIFIPELNDFKYSEKSNLKKSFKEYDCELRSRLGDLIDAKDDLWWKLDNKLIEKHSVEIGDYFEQVVFKEWFDKLNSREKIYINWETVYKKTHFQNIAKLQIAYMKLLNNNAVEGKSMVKEYLGKVEKEHGKSPHYLHVLDQLKKLGIKL